MRTYTLSLLSVFVLPSTATALLGSSGNFWFSFGDSYTSTGFNVTGTQPIRPNPFGNPPYPGNTACGNVPNWIDYAATQLNSSVVQVYNHAYYGATIDLALAAPPPIPGPIKYMDEQVDDFLNFEAPGKAYYPGWSSSNSLFSFWIGINDVASTYVNNGTHTAYNAVLINRYFELVQSVYSKGARHFLFLTVPPIERAPLNLAQTSEANRTDERTAILDFNRQLKLRATTFAATHLGVTSQVYDTQPLINTILDHPAAFGLQDATTYGNATNLAWCDFYHISPPVHLQLAKSVAPLIRPWFI